uniref:Serpentine receptor class gamma n=1 Tax=Panagrellus redivivus TaxID=6233 RepID=A0A7E4VF81_PANRE
MFGFYFLNYIRSMFVIAESLNRFILLLYVDKQTDRYDLKMSKLIWPYFVFAFVVALSQSWFYFWCTFEVRSMGSMEGYSLVGTVRFFPTNGSLRSGIIGFTAAAACILFNGCAAILLVRRKQQGQSRTGFNLFMIAFIDFLFHLYHAITEISFVLVRIYPQIHGIINYTFVMRTWVVDLDCLHRPWILLLMSKSIRHAAFVYVYPGYTNSTLRRSTIVPSQQNRSNSLRQSKPNIFVKTVSVRIE